MPKVSIVTDSAAGLDAETVQRYGIHVLPLTIHLGNESFREGLDISSEQFLARLSQASDFPTVSSPSVSEIQNLYEQIALQSTEILSLHVSSALEQVYERARKASEGFVGRCKIEVIDSQTVALGQSILARAAAESAAAGTNLDDVVRLVRGMIPHIYSIFFVETLDYLERDGRIGVAQAMLGTMLNIKPLLTIEEGDIIPMEKVRTREKAIEKLYEFIAEFSHIEELMILQDHTTEDTADLLERLKTLFIDREIPTYTYGPSLAAHLGPTAMGAVIYEGV